MKITPFNGSNFFNGSKPFLGGTGRNKNVIKIEISTTVFTENNGKVDSVTQSSSTVDINGQKTEKTDFVYEPGQFSIRGGIVDIFSFSSDLPYRIEFFGDECLERTNKD